MKADARSLSTLITCCLFLSLVFIVVPQVRAFVGGIADREILADGMTVLHSEKKALPIVKVVVAVRAGSITEPSEKAGLANLTAELLNEGTESRSSEKISDQIEFVGGSLHAAGGQEYATVTLSVLKKDVALGFDLLSDVILHPIFTEAEVARKKAIIKSSILQEKEDPGDVASKAFLKAVFGENPYGRPVEGTAASIDSITRADIVAFHNAYYAPNNTIMAVSGDISGDELTSLLNKYFKGWQKREIPRRLLAATPPQAGPKVIKIQKEITQANIILGHAGITRDNPDYYAVQVMNYILGGGGFASRLMDNIRDDKGLSYDVRSFFSADKYAGAFEVVLQTKNRSANTAVDEILKEMDRISEAPVSDKELEDAKSFLTGSFPLRIDTNDKIARFLVAVEFYGLGLDYAENYKKFINAVSKDDVLRAAKKYLHTKDYVLVVVGDMNKASLRY
jgi:zinc protease